MLAITMYIPGNDKESKILRKTLVQNCNLMAVLVFRSISESVEHRLKTLEDVVSAGINQNFFVFVFNSSYHIDYCLDISHSLVHNEGFMTCSEMEYFKTVKADVNLFWLPGLWFTRRLREAQIHGRIIDPLGAQLIMKVFILIKIIS